MHKVLLLITALQTLSEAEHRCCHLIPPCFHGALIAGAHKAE